MRVIVSGAAATAPLPQNAWLYGHDVEAEFEQA